MGKRKAGQISAASASAQQEPVVTKKPRELFEEVLKKTDEQFKESASQLESKLSNDLGHAYLAVMMDRFERGYRNAMCKVEVSTFSEADCPAYENLPSEDEERLKKIETHIFENNLWKVYEGLKSASLDDRIEIEGVINEFFFKPVEKYKTDFNPDFETPCIVKQDEIPRIKKYMDQWFLAASAHHKYKHIAEFTSTVHHSVLYGNSVSNWYPEVQKHLDFYKLLGALELVVPAQYEKAFVSLDDPAEPASASLD
jgi:hypothetical protein